MAFSKAGLLVGHVMAHLVDFNDPHANTNRRTKGNSQRLATSAPNK